MAIGTEILAAAGDIGGAMALLPALCELRKRKIDFSLSDHGVISGKARRGWNKISEKESFENISSGKTSLLIFTTSVNDVFPLKLARASMKSGIKAICLLDNWMNYRFRMEIDGEGFFIPDLFLVMDDYAKAEAVKDGFPEGKVDRHRTACACFTGGGIRKIQESPSCWQREKRNFVHFGTG
jgi:hypothetical protein